MKNQLTKEIDDVVGTIDKKLANDLKHIVVVNAANSRYVSAIEGVLHLLENKVFPPRTRSIRPSWIRALLKLADVQARYDCAPVHRTLFMTVQTNDVSHLQKWGFLVSCGDGRWSLTKLSCGWLMGMFKVSSDVSYRYNIENSWTFGLGKQVSVADFDVKRVNVYDTLRRLLRSNIPMGTPVPEFVNNEFHGLPQWYYEAVKLIQQFNSARESWNSGFTSIT